MTQKTAKASKIEALKALTPASEQVKTTLKIFAHLALRDVLWNHYKIILKRVTTQKQYFDSDGNVFEARFNDKFFAENTYTLQGVDLYGKPEYNGSQADLYHNEMDRQTKDFGMIHGVNTICVIDEKIRSLQNELLAQMMPITDINPIDVYGDARKQLIEITMKMLGPLVGQIDQLTVEANKRKVYDEFLTK
jgi:hypothetical protein